MRLALLAAAFTFLCAACGKPPTPEELADQTATDLDNFWQEAVATARITNTMQVRDELFASLEGLQRNPPTSRPVIPDTSVTTDAFTDLRVLTKRIFVQANVLSSGGTTVTFRITGTDLCTPLRGNFNVDTVCVKNADKLKLAIRAVGGTAGVDLTFLVNDTIAVGTMEIRKGVSVGVTVDLANARQASEFVNGALGTDSPFRNVTFDAIGRVEARLRKHGPSDFEASVSFLDDVSGTITDNNGFTRSGKSTAKSPAVALRVEGLQKSVTASIDLGPTEYTALWSDFFDYNLKNPMVWALSGLSLKAALKDGGARTFSAALGAGGNTLSYAGQTVVSVTLNPNGQNRFDVDFSTGSSGLYAATVKPGFAGAIAFNLQPVANAGSTIDPKILSSTYSYDLSSSDQAPKLELSRPTQTIDASWRLTQGTLSLSSPGNGSARLFSGPACVAFRQAAMTSSMHPFLDFWMRCEECTSGQCGGVTTQSSQCNKYISCYEASGGTVGALSSAYGPGGTCWTNVSTAESCTNACISGLASLKSAFPSVSACQ